MMCQLTMYQQLVAQAALKQSIAQYFPLETIFPSENVIMRCNVRWRSMACVHIFAYFFPLAKSEDQFLSLNNIT